MKKRQGRDPREIAAAIEGSMENVATAMEELTVGRATHADLVVLRQVIAAAIADGAVTVAELAGIVAQLDQVERGIDRGLALDVYDLQVGRVLAGNVDTLASKRRQKAPETLRAAG